MNKFFEQQDKVLNSQLLVISLVELAKQRGIHPDSLLKGSKLFYQDIRATKFKISQQQFSTLINNAHKLMPQADVSFLLGRRLFPSQLGQVGSALLNAVNLRDMLRIVQCYQAEIFPYMFVMERSHNHQCYLTFNHAICFENQTYQLFMCELLASFLISALKWRMGSLPELTLKFPYQAPEHIEQYQAYLPGLYHFNIGQGAQKKISVDSQRNLFCLQVTISQHTLKQSFSESNQAIKRHHLNQLCKSHFSVGLMQCLIQFIAKSLDDNKPLSLDTAAEHLKMSVSTLKRKLSAHKTSYQYLLDLYRQQQAVFQLTEQGFSNEKVAEALNFSDMTNFRRSFKRWTGVTPNALKQAHCSNHH